MEIFKILLILGVVAANMDGQNTTEVEVKEPTSEDTNHDELIPFVFLIFILAMFVIYKCIRKYQFIEMPIHQDFVEYRGEDSEIQCHTEWL